MKKLIEALRRFFAWLYAKPARDQDAHIVTMGGTIYLRTKGKGEMSTNALIIAGREVPVEFPVVRWDQDGGLGLPSAHLKPRSRRPDVFVFHWDVCKSSHQCHEVLLQRGLGIHFMIDGDAAATLYQLCDPAKWIAQHAPPINWRSIGVEVNNPVLEKWWNPQDGRPMVKEQAKPNGRQVWNHQDFTAAQKSRCVELADAICKAFEIPKRIPLPSQKLDEIESGVVGHYQVSSTKVDPGLTLWPAFENAGYERT